MTYKTKTGNILFYVFVFFLMLFGSACTAIGAEESAYIYIPAGAQCDGINSQDIDYNTVVTGQNVEIILLNGFKYNNKVIASNDSVMTGNITDKKTKNGEVLRLKIRFTSIRTPYNNIIPVNSVVELENTKNAKTLLANEKLKLFFSQPITVGAR